MRRHRAARVATIELAPGPLADVGGRAVRSPARGSSTTSRVDPPRALLVRALDGVGDGRAAGARRPRGCAIRPRCWPSFPAPTVAVWNGPAIGAGAELLLAADLA